MEIEKIKTKLIFSNVPSERITTLYQNSIPYAIKISGDSLSFIVHTSTTMKDLKIVTNYFKSKR